MCNIAGYVGSHEAAPILIEMMKKQEGWGGGYYTGLATIDDEGKIQHAKITGDTQRMLDYTDAAHLKGTVGILHSRSKSGGDDLWSHPFIGTGGHTAYVANGSYGIFKEEPYLSDRTVIFDSLEADGYHSRSLTLQPVGHYPRMSDGSAAHISDVMAQYITRFIDCGYDASMAMDEAFCTMPSEIVGLMLHDAEPDCIIWSRINQPMMVGFAPHGTYLATTALAFPDDAENITMLPPLSGGRVYYGLFTSKPYDAPPCTVAPITGRVWHDAYDAVVKALTENGPMTIGRLAGTVKPVFDNADCYPSAMVAYNILHSLKGEGRLGEKLSRVSGMRKTIDAPLLKAYLK